MSTFNIKNSKGIVTLLLCLTSISFSQTAITDSCQRLLGKWDGVWDDLEQVQRADIHFLALQDKEFSGFYTLENGQRGALSGSCTAENEHSGYLVFARTPPLYNPCYGQLDTTHLTIRCLNPNQSGTFKKI